MFKHRLKKRVFDKNQKCYRDIIVHTNARFGSDVRDKHDKEIFEGDKVKVFGEEIFPVTFEDGKFKVGKYSTLADFPKNNLEVIEEDSNADAHSQN